jgi:hypothetical protein
MADNVCLMRRPAVIAFHLIWLICGHFCLQWEEEGCGPQITQIEADLMGKAEQGAN